MRNWMNQKRKRIAFGLAVLLVALQLMPLPFTDAMGELARAAAEESQTPGSGNEADGQVTKSPDESQNPDETQDPDQTADPEGTKNPEETKKPEETQKPDPTERPLVLEPSQVDCIVATGGAAFVEDTKVRVSGLQASDRTTNSLTLTWKEAPDLKATGYYIYQYDFELRDYVYLATVKDTKYIIKDLKPGQEFYYTVSAYNQKDKLQSHFCAPLHTYTRPEKLSAVAMKSHAKTSITLTWQKVGSATGYQIYRATETGGFTQVGSTTGTTYKDTGLTNGTTYRYMVRTYAFVADNTGTDSAVLYMTTKTKAPTIKAIKGGDGRVRIKWKKLTKADGYQIYRFNGTSYVSVAKLPANTTVKYINTGLVNGQTYRYKVCGYRRVGNVDYDGDQTKEYSAKAVKVGKTSKGAFLFKTKRRSRNLLPTRHVNFLRKK